MKNISTKLNKKTIKFLKQRRLKYDKDISGKDLDNSFVTFKEIKSRDLRTHPDLTGEVMNLTENLPNISHGYVMGYSVIINADDTIFAIATSMNDLLLRLDPETQQAALDSGGYSNIEHLDKDWVGLDFWMTDRDSQGLWCAKALEYANELPRNSSDGFTQKILGLFKSE